jgi:hypothetical protein
MKALLQTIPLVASLALVLPVPVGAADPDDVAADVPAPAKNDVFHPAVRLVAADGVLDSGPSWGHSSPWIADIDGDGVKDLVVGDFSGLFRFYRNEGTDRQPRYARAVNLQAGGVDALVPIY